MTNKNLSKRTILFLTADPTDQARLRLTKEQREIQEKIQLSKYRDFFTFESRASARVTDITQALLDINPQVVHFSGHGTENGALVFEDNKGTAYVVDPEGLADLFGLVSDNVECVILNACYSKVQAQAIAAHINYVIGMKQKIDDSSAILFSIGFYQALGAGKSVEDAFAFGLVTIRLHGIPSHLTPTLIRREDVIASQEKERIQREERLRGQNEEDQRRNALMRKQVQAFDLCLRRSLPGSTEYIQINTRDITLRLIEALSQNISSCALWWFRGYTHLSIARISNINDNEILEKLKLHSSERKYPDYWLIGNFECNIADLWIYRDPMLERQHIILHLAPMPRFNNNEFAHFSLSDYDFERLIPRAPRETRAYFMNRYIDVDEAEDGFTEIDGQIVEVDSYEIRTRNLVDDFLIIAPHMSVFNYSKNDNIVNTVYRNLLQSKQITHDILEPLTFLQRDPWMTLYD